LISFDWHKKAQTHQYLRIPGSYIYTNSGNETKIISKEADAHFDQSPNYSNNTVVMTSWFIDKPYSSVKNC